MAKGKYPKNGNWVKKELLKNQTRKLVEEVMNTQEFKEMQRKQEEQAVLQALGRFCFIACDYLELKHNYKATGMKHFLEHVLKRMCYTGEDEKYFEDYYEYAKNEVRIDILAELGLEVAEEGEEDGKS